jgi:hypothetical protein
MIHDCRIKINLISTLIEGHEFLLFTRKVIYYLQHFMSESEWLWSSFHRYVKSGIYPMNWGSDENKSLYMEIEYMQ